MTTPLARRGGALIAHVQTWRPYTVWYVGLLGLAGAGLTHDGQHWSRLVLAWAAPTVGWIGGHYIGDYYDRELDAISKPQRPIPSGRLAPRVAFGTGVGCMVAVAAMAVLSGFATIAVALLAVAGIVAYGRVLKARGLSGNLIRGVLGGLAITYGALAVGPPAAAALVPVLCFAVAVWAHDTSSNLVGTLRDMQGDRAGGYQTLPVRRGARVASYTALLFYALFVLAAIVGGVLPELSRGSADSGLDLGSGSRQVTYFVILVAAVSLGAFAWRTVLAHGTDIAKVAALRAHELLVLERVAFAGAVIGLGFGAIVAAILVIPMLIATTWSQAKLRAGYELDPADNPQPELG